MKDELKRLADDVEEIADDLGDKALVDRVKELCTAVRELDAERDAERLTWVSCASLLGLWHVDPARYRPLLDAALKKLAERGVPPHIIAAIAPTEP